MALPFPETLDDTLRAWRQHGAAAGHSDRTIDGRICTLRRLMEDGVNPTTATSDELVTWLAELPLVRSSRATYRAHLRAWFRWLRATGRREDDPSEALPQPRAPRGTPHPVTVSEVAAILAACAGPRNGWTRAYVVLAAYAGLRVHEIAKVRGEDFRGGEVVVVGKGGHEGTVPLHPKVLELVAVMPTTGSWFPSQAPSGHVHRCSVSSAISRAMRRAGVPGVPHALRHHFCTEVLRASGGDLRTTQRAARHASPSTTAIYTQVADETLARAVAGIPTA